MAQQSLPSNLFPAIDIPEPTNLSAEFVYNFFTPDEKVEGALSAVPDFAKNKSKDLVEQNVIANAANYNRFVPRYIKINWTPKISTQNINDIRNVALNISIQSNNDKIYSEDGFGFFNYSNIVLQDNQIDSVLRFYVNRLMQDSGVTSSLAFSGSQMDFAKKTNSLTSNAVTPNFLSNILGDIESSGMSVDKINSTNHETDNVLFELRNIASNIQIKNMFLNSTLSTMNNSVANIYEDELAVDLADSLDKQNFAIQNFPSTRFFASEYSFIPDNLVDFLPTQNIEHFDPKSFPIGYIIEKTEINPSGIVLIHNPIYVETPFVGEKIDFDVKYGYQYQYKVFSVYAISTLVPNNQTGQIGIGTFLIKSKPVVTDLITCDEKVAPPPPSDFFVAWDYLNNAPRITWSMPVNRQRDVKYFQIFRRDSIDNPFELLAMYDFDDSQIKSQLSETDIDPRLVTKTDASTAYYLDKDMTKDDTYIYSVCCIDAHGYSSNYSLQMQVSFDKYKNSIVRKMISPEGAPKAYPNCYLLQDTFVDTIRTSNATKMNVYFDPEYLDVFQKINNKKNYNQFIKTDGNTSYKIQLINVDLQKQQVFTVRLKDKRTT